MTRPLAPRYGIAEWYGQSFRDLDSSQRQTLARIARDDDAEPPTCPFQHRRSCSKRGGVCSLQCVQWTAPDRMGPPAGPRVVTCPHRFDEAGVVVRWLAEIVGFDPAITQMAREVPFMQAVANPDRAAGRVSIWCWPRQRATPWTGMALRFRLCTSRGPGWTQNLTV